jgi:hypothetical protein
MKKQLFAVTYESVIGIAELAFAFLSLEFDSSFHYYGEHADERAGDRENDGRIPMIHESKR